MEYPVEIAFWLELTGCPKKSGRVPKKYTKLVEIAYGIPGTPQCPLRAGNPLFLFIFPVSTSLMKPPSKISHKIILQVDIR